MTTYEIRDDPDELPIICVARLSIEVLVYKMHPTRGERLIGAI